MKTLKTIGASVLAVIIVLGMGCFLVGGVLCLIAQDGVKWLRRKFSAREYAPVLVAGRRFQHVPVKTFSGPVGMVMDADGFVEPPAARGPVLLASPAASAAPNAQTAAPSRWDSPRASRAYETGVVNTEVPGYNQKSTWDKGVGVSDHKGFRIVGGKDLEASRIAATAHVSRDGLDLSGTLAFPTDGAERDRLKSKRDARTSASQPALPANVVRMTDFRSKKKD